MDDHLPGDSISTLRPLRRHPVLLIRPVVLTGCTAWAGWRLADHFSWPLLVAAMLIALNAAFRSVVMLRPGRADSVRIRPRFALRSMRWSELRGVQTPGRWDTEVYVMNLAGTPRATGFSLDYLDDLVRLSGRASVPRLSELGPPVRREPLPRSREQTQRDLAARVERVRALNAELLSDPDSPTPANETGVGNESPNP